MRFMNWLVVVLLLAGCEGGKFEDTVSTLKHGYALRCIDGTQYVLMSSEHGLAVTVHLGTDGKPRGCDPK